MQDFRDEGFILEDDLSFRSLRSDELSIEGRIRCQNRLFIDVKKFLEVREHRGRTQVRTVDYRYHVGVEEPEARSIFRYDNAHRYVKEGHPDAHHKHRFDHTTWGEITPPEWIGEERWPHLSYVIEELR
jgi:Family of unknown function (DUF6516)